MARPGYLKARQARDKEYEWLEMAEERLAGVDSLTDSSGRDLAPALKDIHRKDATKAVEEHRQALERAELAFSVFAKLPRPKIPIKRFDMVLSLQLSMTKQMFEAIALECERKSVRKVDVIRDCISKQLNLSQSEEQEPSATENS
jgi:hypothetical protein